MSSRRDAALSESRPGYLAKRRELLRVAADSFKEKGYEGTTLNDIAARFGTDRASIYYYVASKQELFQEVFKSSAGQVLDENIAAAEVILGLEVSPADKLRLLIERLLKSYEANYPYVYVYIQEDMAKISYQQTGWAQTMARKTRRFEAIVTEVIQAGIADGSFRDDIPLALLTNAIYGMVNWTHRWYRPDGRYGAQELCDAFCTVFLEGALRPPPIVPFRGHLGRRPDAPADEPLEDAPRVSPLPRPATSDYRGLAPAVARSKASDR
jgi:AcrR family transcriptional regulator